MIRLRLSAFEDSSRNLKYECDENLNLKETVDKVLFDNGIEEKNFSRFQVLVNGKKIEADLWPAVSVNSGDNILIAPTISGGSFGQIFKTAVIIAVAVVVSAYAGPGVGGALLTAGATIGTTILLNNLIPTPTLGMPSSGASYGSSSESSQMYSISGQSNSAKQYGYVPKVYGRHRIYPNIAANPYTEIEADPQTGQLVQFFYAIYDFGFGPGILSDLKIGDSYFSDFSDLEYRIVDPNKPAISEGAWDDRTYSNFVFYKGDYEQDGTVAVLNGNRDAGDALEEYQVVRNASPSTDGSSQEITVNFTCSRGLIAYGTDGSTSERNIDIEVHFAKVGTEDWKPFSDLTHVSNFKAVGGNDVYEYSSIPLYPLTTGGWPYTQLRERLENTSNEWDETHTGIIYSGYERYTTYGITHGTTSFLVRKGYLVLGDKILFEGRDLGQVLTLTSYNSEYEWAQFSVPLPITIEIGEKITKLSVPSGTEEYSISWSSTEGRLTKRLESGGKLRITRQTTEAALSMVKFSPRIPDDYKIRVVRIVSTSPKSFSILDDLAISSIVTRFDRTPIITDKRHLFLELKIRATNQINGNISNLSGVVSSVLNTWNGTAFVKQETSNPAWVFLDLLTGEINKRALPTTRVHLESLLEWANYCDVVPDMSAWDIEALYPRHQSNFVLDFETTLQTILSSVSNAAQASLNIIDGKYGVLIDKRRTIPVQVFTPRNSSNFSSTRNYGNPPHAVKVKYIDPLADWSIAERIVYDDGYDESTATNIEELSSFAITNQEQAWRYGRYMMAQNRLRQENISITVDFEHLVCTRGDYVQISQDIMKVGGRPARVEFVSGNNIKIDDNLTTLPATDYAYVYRSITGEIKTSTLTVVSSNEFELDGDIPSVGDLIVIGELGQVVMDCLVKSILPNDDLSAQLILVEKADAVYDVETSMTFPAYSPQISSTAESDAYPPGEVVDLAVLENTWKCLGNGYEYFIKIDWDIPAGSAYSIFEIYIDSGRGFDLYDYTKYTEYRYVVEDNRIGIEHKFKVLAVSASGKKLDLGVVGQISAIPLSKTDRPSNVEFLYTNITGEVLQLDWPAISDCDCDEYLIRYSPLLTGTWEASIPLARVDRNTTLISTQARTGTYLIKALDFNGNESQIATAAITTIPNLFGLNLIETITDFPALTGEKIRTIAEADALRLKNIVSGGVETNQYYSDGYYNYSNLLDLGEIYTVRLQSLIQAEGYTANDLMSNWALLSDVIAMANSTFSDWDVKTQYRGTDQFNTMAQWTSLDLVDPISEGVQDNWSEWRDFTISDATARIFQFRLKLISNKPSVSPRVIDGTIKVDVPDRTEKYNNLVVPVGGYEVLYAPAFMGPGTTPNIQVTIESAESGDYFLFDYKSLDGFKIRIYDKNDIEVSRQIDVAVAGYGRKNTTVI